MTTATYTSAPAGAPPRRTTAWVALALLAAMLLGCALALAEGIGHLAELPFSLVIDGEDVTDAVRADLHGLSGLEAVFGLACAVLALLAAAIIVPLAVMFSLLVAGVVVAGVLLAVLGVPLLVATAVTLVLLSPVLVAVWLLVRLVRGRRRAWATVPR
jgi:hypothetical protein